MALSTLCLTHGNAYVSLLIEGICCITHLTLYLHYLVLYSSQPRVENLLIDDGGRVVVEKQAAHNN